MQGKYTQLFTSKRIWIMLFLGFSSGLPLAVTSSTLQAWLTTSNISTQEIGIFSLVGLPYLYKFLWSPLMDRFIPPFLGRRRGWMLFTQLGVVVGMIWMGLLNPKHMLIWMGVAALVTAFIAASQDIAIDAYRTDVLKLEERGLGAAVFSGGWRLGAMLSGGLALVLAGHWGWPVTYFFLAGTMLIGMIATLISPEPSLEKSPPRTLQEAVVMPFKDFLKRDYVVWILIFIVMYKIGDAFAYSLMSTFLMRGIGFSLTTVGSVFKIYGVFATIAGVFIGGLLLPKLKLYRALFIFGVFQALSNLMFVWLALVDKNYSLLIAAITIENVTSGIASAGFLAFLMGLCNHHFSATQYALLSAIAAIGRVLLGPVAGWIAERFGWVIFYEISFVFALPALFILMYLKPRLHFNRTQVN